MSDTYATQPKDSSEKGLALESPPLESHECGPYDCVQTAPMPTRYRVIAILIILQFYTGITFAEHILSPLKTELKKKLHIDNAQYGVIASATSVVNTVLPIVGGAMMDRWGGAKVAVGSSFMIVLGSLLAAVATLHSSYDLLIVGEILIGFGSTVGEVCQYKLYPHYVAGTRMATVYGLSVGWSRLVQMIAKLSAVPMTNIQHHWGWAFWISFMVSVYSFAFVIAYFIFERSLPKEWRPCRQVKVGGTWLETSGVGSVLQLPKFFWILVATQMCQHGAYRVYSLNTTDIQVKTRGTSQQTAGYKSSVQAVIPIVLAPVAGVFFDRFGHRMTFVSITAVLHIIVFVLIGLTKVNAIAPIIISSFAYTTNLLPWFVSLPILIDGEDLIGTAFGVFQAFANSGALVMTVAAGALQDATPHQSYNYVIYLIIAVKVFDVFLGPFYIWLDRMWLNGSLQVSEARRVAILREAKDEGETLKGLEKSRWATITCGGLYIACAACGITLYVVYSLGSST